jgi:hypothetical protein
VRAEDLVGAFESVRALDDRSALTDVKAAATRVAKVRAWCDAADVKIAGLIAALSPVPENDIARSSRSSRRKAKRDMSRKETVEKVPQLGDALANGDVGGEHVDAVTDALAGVEGTAALELARRAGELVEDADGCSPEELARRLRAERRNLDDESGIDRLERQRRDSRYRSRVDPVTGMYKFWGQLDPLSGLKLSNWLAAEVAARFAEAVPEGAPSDPVEKNAFLAALALHGLVERGATGRGATGRGSGRPEMTVVIDTRVADERGAPVVDWGPPVDLPHEVLVDLFGQSDVAAVIVRNGAVVHAPGRMDLGRTTRLANAAQRRVLRALYPRCAIPDCPVRFDHCKIHHVVWWRHGGRTDLDNLLPVCFRHHRAIHHEGWTVELAADRTLLVTLPDGRVMTTGPPRRAAA